MLPYPKLIAKNRWLVSTISTADEDAVTSERGDSTPSLSRPIQAGGLREGVFGMNRDPLRPIFLLSGYRIIDVGSQNASLAAARLDLRSLMLKGRTFTFMALILSWCQFFCSTSRAASFVCRVDGVDLRVLP
ncbi:hypothetical protein BE20_07740 [Sorangium cellulosum]|nr:hypothetical protein BE20_07740 [Sorangium cellulosum]